MYLMMEKFKFNYIYGLAFLSVALPFLLINFNEKFGFTFGFMVLFGYVIHDAIISRSAKSILYNDEKDTERFSDLLIAVFGGIVFFVLTALAASVLKGYPTLSVESFQAVLGIVQATTPILQNNWIITLLGWGVFIPWMETDYFFGKIHSMLLLAANITNPRYDNPRVWVIWLIISAWFVAFHLTVRALQVTDTGTVIFDTIGLVGTFIFGLVSCVMVTVKRELSSAKIMHIVVNSIASVKNLLGG